MLYFIILMITMCKVKSMPVLPTSIVTRLFYGLSLLLTLPTGKKRFSTNYCEDKWLIWVFEWNLDINGNL